MLVMALECRVLERVLELWLVLMSVDVDFCDRGDLAQSKQTTEGTWRVVASAT